MPRAGRRGDALDQLDFSLSRRPKSLATAEGDTPDRVSRKIKMNSEDSEGDFSKLHEKQDQLLANIKAEIPQLESLLEKVGSHWGYEDPVYRFYYGSFKVYWLQDTTRTIVEALKALAPERTTLSRLFEEIIRAGASGKEFESEHNSNWSYHTRPFLEAFFHAKYFLEMVVKYGKELEEAPQLLPSGWAAVLCLYGLR
jgi:hypothetical protein